ncbi:MAG: DUF502 domain-containing protein [Bacteroidales bacterium]|nr:DUF502 domain-containing protein [Bacteroidales bacterium]MDT8432792.1 DUF502 domain-containing protein [Bacteroidales bacterium]
MKRIVNYFLQGLLFIAPIGITVYIVYLLFNFVDGILKEYIEMWLGIHIPGLGIIILIVLLVFIGFLGQTILARPFKVLFNRLMKRVPIIKVIYSAFNDLFSAFVGKGKKFNQPVMVMVNRESNIEKLGFLTETDLSELGELEKVAVYFPHSYNFSGELFIVPRESIRHVDVNPAEAMKFIVSAGVAGWEKIEDIT